MPVRRERKKPPQESQGSRSRVAVRKIAAPPAKSSSKRVPRSKAAASLVSNVIVVPKPAAGSYNPSRPLAGNTLINHQVHHFQQVEKSWPEAHQSGHNAAAILTEGEAAEYVRKVTALIHERAAKPKRAPKPRTRKAGTS